jgi:hypothetical protein
MPRYFFHIVDGSFRVDPEGMELPDIAAARVEAIAAAGEILRDSAKKWKGTEWQMHVINEDQSTVLKLVFSAEQFS